MSKEAVLLIVDVGHSMDEPFSESASRAKIAFECCKLTLQQKLFNNSSHELGLMLFGDNDADDGNSLLLKNIEKPDVDFVRKVEELSNAKFDNHQAGGDIFSTINYSIRLMNEHCGKKKYIKRMFLFTNGMGETDFNDREVRNLASKIESSGIKINIIPIDFMTTYDSASNEL